MKACFTFGSAAVLLAISSLSNAAESLSAHQHGIGSLDIAVDGNSVLMELRVPGQDLLGFEQLKTDKQKTKAKQAIELLQQKEWFKLNASANCKLLEGEAEIATDEHDDHKEHGHHDDHADHDEHKEHGHHDDHADHDEHKEHGHHDDHADHDEHKEHGHHDDHDKHKETGHIEFHASWLYQCQQPAKINSLSSSLFAQFPGSQKLKVRILLPSGQKLGRLTAKNNQFSF